MQKASYWMLCLQQKWHTMGILRVAGLDPALANLGMARMTLDVETCEMTLEQVDLISTEKQAGKVVRQNSDDLRRARELHNKVHEFTADCDFVFSEVPTGAQSARAALSFGVAIGILSSIRKPLIEVQPFETKLASVGKKTASKAEIIAWATAKYPEAGWLTKKRAGENSFTEANEHMADAVAVVHAGVRTKAFESLLVLWRQLGLVSKQV